MSLKEDLGDCETFTMNDDDDNYSSQRGYYGGEADHGLNDLLVITVALVA